MTNKSLGDSDYAELAEFRALLRKFLAFSEQRANEVGLSAQQHQALLAIRGAETDTATIGYIADRLIVKPHSASELVHRLEKLGLVERVAAPNDRRKSLIVLTGRTTTILEQLSYTHREEIARMKPLLGDLLNRFG